MLVYRSVLVDVDNNHQMRLASGQPSSMPLDYPMA